MGSLRQWGLPPDACALIREFLAPRKWPSPLCNFLEDTDDDDDRYCAPAFSVPPARWSEVIGCWAVAEVSYRHLSCRVHGVLFRSCSGYYILGCLNEDIQHCLGQHPIDPETCSLTVPPDANTGREHRLDWYSFYGCFWPHKTQPDDDEDSEEEDDADEAEADDEEEEEEEAPALTSQARPSV